jgi:hypothetical protein
MTDHILTTSESGDPEAVRAYMTMAEQRIAAAFVVERLYGHLAGGSQGPHTLTFSIRLYEYLHQRTWRAPCASQGP